MVGMSDLVIERINGTVKRILEKSCQTLADVFRVPKERPTPNRVKGIVYKVKCNSCSFTYIGETKRTWETRWSEHKPGVRKHNYSAVKDHAETTGHEVRLTDVEILERGVINHQKRLFLEAVHSVKTKDSVNEHIELPSAYLPLITSLQ